MAGLGGCLTTRESTRLHVRIDIQHGYKSCDAEKILFYTVQTYMYTFVIYASTFIYLPAYIHKNSKCSSSLMSKQICLWLLACQSVWCATMHLKALHSLLPDIHRGSSKRGFTEDPASIHTM
jgi:hypothetical protein